MSNNNFPPVGQPDLTILQPRLAYRPAPLRSIITGFAVSNPGNQSGLTQLARTSLALTARQPLELAHQPLGRAGLQTPAELRQFEERSSGDTYRQERFYTPSFDRLSPIWRNRGQRTSSTTAVNPGSALFRNYADEIGSNWEQPALGIAKVAGDVETSLPYKPVQNFNELPTNQPDSKADQPASLESLPFQQTEMENRAVSPNIVEPAVQVQLNRAFAPLNRPTSEILANRGLQPDSTTSNSDYPPANLTTRRAGPTDFTLTSVVHLPKPLGILRADPETEPYSLASTLPPSEESPDFPQLSFNNPDTAQTRRIKPGQLETRSDKTLNRQIRRVAQVAPLPHPAQVSYNPEQTKVEVAPFSAGKTSFEQAIQRQTDSSFPSLFQPAAQIGSKPLPLITSQGLFGGFEADLNTVTNQSQPASDPVGLTRRLEKPDFPFVTRADLTINRSGRFIPTVTQPALFRAANTVNEEANTSAKSYSEGRDNFSGAANHSQREVLMDQTLAKPDPIYNKELTTLHNRPIPALVPTPSPPGLINREWSPRVAGKPFPLTSSADLGPALPENLLAVQTELQTELAQPPRLPVSMVERKFDSFRLPASQIAEFKGLDVSEMEPVTARSIFPGEADLTYPRPNPAQVERQSTTTPATQSFYEKANPTEPQSSPAVDGIVAKTGAANDTIAAAGLKHFANYVERRVQPPLRLSQPRLRPQPPLLSATQPVQRFSANAGGQPSGGDSAGNYFTGALPANHTFPTTRNVKVDRDTSGRSAFYRFEQKDISDLDFGTLTESRRETWEGGSTIGFSKLGQTNLTKGGLAGAEVQRFSPTPDSAGYSLEEEPLEAGSFGQDQNFPEITGWDNTAESGRPVERIVFRYASPGGSGSRQSEGFTSGGPTVSTRPASGWAGAGHKAGEQGHASLPGVGFEATAFEEFGAEDWEIYQDNFTPITQIHRQLADTTGSVPPVPDWATTTAGAGGALENAEEKADSTETPPPPASGFGGNSGPAGAAHPVDIEELTAQIYRRIKEQLLLDRDRSGLPVKSLFF